MTPDQRAKRLHYHLYESLEGITEHAERIVKLEELVSDMWTSCPTYVQDCADCQHVKIDNSGEWPNYECDFFDRMQELGIGL